MHVYYQKKPKEVIWMLKLSIVFGYVLKNQQVYDFVKGDNRVLVGSKFLALPKKSTRVI